MLYKCLIAFPTNTKYGKNISWNSFIQRKKEKKKQPHTNLKVLYFDWKMFV